MRGKLVPRNKVIVVDDSDDEVIIDDSDDIESLSEDYCDEDCQINEAFGDAVSELVNEGFDIDSLFDPSWK